MPNPTHTVEPSGAPTPIRNSISDSNSDFTSTYKRLTDEEVDRVKRKVRALQRKTLLRPDLVDVFDLCDGVILTLLSNRIDCAVVPRLKTLFDTHGVARPSQGHGRAEGCEAAV